MIGNFKGRNINPMGFSPVAVGLAGQVINHPYNEPRKACFHRGIDITSSKKPLDFSAGIYGRVIDPTQTAWGTISVQPFHDPTAVVQYLHCSQYSVKVGQAVAPWTILGKTGDTAPPNSGVKGIHLHLQVVEPGSPLHSCWGARNYVDPTRWDLGNPLVGTWTCRTAYTIPEGTQQTIDTRHIQSVEIGSSFIHDDTEFGQAPTVRGKVSATTGLPLRSTWPETR
jgi:murein DD-endopeptidase MepM/ murein hydrolase activator NlpD